MRSGGELVAEGAASRHVDELDRGNGRAGTETIQDAQDRSRAVISLLLLNMPTPGLRRPGPISSIRASNTFWARIIAPPALNSNRVIVARPDLAARKCPNDAGKVLQRTAKGSLPILRKTDRYHVRDLGNADTNCRGEAANHLRGRSPSYLLDIHENNAIVLYSDTLSKQIPKSIAANAFNVVREAMHQIEIIRVCALWDSVLTIERIDTDSYRTHRRPEGARCACRASEGRASASGRGATSPKSAFKSQRRYQESERDT